MRKYKEKVFNVKYRHYAFLFIKVLVFFANPIFSKNIKQKRKELTNCHYTSLFIKALVFFAWKRKDHVAGLLQIIILLS